MIGVRFNMRNRKDYAADLWACSGCGAVDTFLHLKWCPTYAELREGKDLNEDKDLVAYITSVMRAREETGQDKN